MEAYRNISKAIDALDAAIYTADVSFGGTKVKRIVEAANVASAAAKELAFLVVTTSSMPSQRDHIFADAMETARLAFKAELLFRLLDNNNRGKFWDESGLGQTLKLVNKLCLDLSMNLIRS